jgi:hypothetical protein
MWLFRRCGSKRQVDVGNRPWASAKLQEIADVCIATKTSLVAEQVQVVVTNEAVEMRNEANVVVGSTPPITHALTI